MPQPHHIPTGLLQFLTEDVGEVYADILLNMARKAETENPDEGASGNTYYVTFKDGFVTIEHHYLPDWPEVRLSLPEFTDHLTRWKEKLAKNAP